MARQTTNHSPSIAVEADFSGLYLAWRKARLRKRPSEGQLAFERCWLDRIDGLGRELRAGRWLPRRAACFCVQRPKAREIHAPDFADRVVHQWLIPRLERIYEPRFIDDSYANRRGKGCLAAVKRLQGFVRQVRDGEGCGGGWCLQLDVRDYFYSIHRPTLYRMLKAALYSAARRQRLAEEEIPGLQSLCHKLLARPTAAWSTTPAQQLRLPPRKRLHCAPPGRGLPIGNLSSQFFANVYLDALDQHLKHHLKVRCYLRYMDDFLLLSPQREELLQWHEGVISFLRDRLGLTLKPAQPQPLDNGVDFLGYRVFAHYIKVRPRVLRHCREKLHHWRRAHLRQQGGFYRIEAPAAELQALRAMLASYLGHFSHANAWRLRQRLLDDFDWLALLFNAAAFTRGELQPRWLSPQASGLHEQLRQLRREYPQAWIAARCGVRFWVSVPRRRLLRQVAPFLWRRKRQALEDAGVSWLELEQSGWLRHGGRVRTICRWHVPCGGGVYE